MSKVTWSWSIKIKFRDNGQQGTVSGMVDTPANATAESILPDVLERLSRQYPGRVVEAWDFRATRKL